MKRIVVLSDIHANLTALRAIVSDFEFRYDIDGIAVLGDIINYGMRPNETIELLSELSLKYSIFCNLWGNHEKAVVDGDTTRFATSRGADILNYTKNVLNEKSMNYLHSMDKAGLCTTYNNIMFVHGSLNDPFWGKINADMDNEQYSSYDYVISGHSHIRHLIEKFYTSDNLTMRGQKRTIFLNPGSVGQPRNHNPKAQYLYVDFEKEKFDFNAVEYAVLAEQNLYINQVDEFYKIRLTNGI